MPGVDFTKVTAECFAVVWEVLGSISRPSVLRLGFQGFSVRI